MSFWYRLLFTRDDDLDLLQIVFLGWVIFLSFVIWKDASGAWEVSTGAWTLIGSVFATLAITGVPIWLARMLAAREKGQPIPETPVVNKYANDAKFYGVDHPAGE